MAAAETPEQGPPLRPPDPGVCEIILPITVFELSDDEFLESEDEEQTALEKNSFCLTSGQSEIVKERRGVEGVNEDHWNDGVLRGKHREKQATPVVNSDGCDKELPDTYVDSIVVSCQNAPDHSEPDQNRAMGFLDPKMQNRPEKENVKISDSGDDSSCDQRMLDSLNTQNKSASNGTDSIVKRVAAVSQGTDPVANKFVQESLPGLPSVDPGRSVNDRGTSPLETGYNETGKSPRKNSKLSEETCQSNKSEEYPDVGTNGQGASPFVNGNCLPRDFPEDTESLTREHCPNPKPDVAGSPLLPEVTGCQERHDMQENTNDSNKNTESDQQLPMNPKETVLLCSKPSNDTNPEPGVAGNLVLSEATGCQEKRDTQEDTNDSNENAESDRQVLMNEKEALTPFHKPNHGNSLTPVEQQAKMTDSWKCFLCDFEGTSSACLKKHIFTMHKDKNSDKIIQRSSSISPERCQKLMKKRKAPKKGRSDRCPEEGGRDKEKPAAEGKKESKYKKFFSKTKVSKPSKRFPCQICSLRFSHPKDFSQHVKEHHNALPYQCPQCEYTADDHLLFLNHLYWHAGYELYQCNFCTFISRHFNSMVKHSYLHTGFKPYSCAVCHLGFTSTSGLSRHAVTHSTGHKSHHLHVAQEKDACPPKTYMCDDCDIVFYTQALLQSHKKYHLQRRAHDDAPSVNLQKCKTRGTECEEADGSQEGNTNSSSKLVEGKSDYSHGMYRCDQCRFTFHTEEHLVYHRATHVPVQPSESQSGGGTGSPEAQPTARPSVKLYKCLQCAYLTPTFDNLRIHLATHTGQKAFKCHVCGKSFRNSSHIKRHSLLHQRDCHRCSWCLFTGSTEEDLKRHEETCKDKGPAGKRLCPSAVRGESSGGQTGKEETNGNALSEGSRTHLHKCKHCTYHTYALDNLKTHTRIHTGEKPYACDVCQKKFRTSSHLRRHTSVHQELKFNCSDCEYSASTWQSFKRHLASHGKGLPVKPPLHKCEKCSYSTVRKENLKAHFRIHTGERPYKCPHCHHAFRMPSHLKKHLHTHRKLECGKCDFSTLDERALQKHARTHKKKDSPADQECSSREVYKCTKCRITFSKLRLFHAHKKKHRENQKNETIK